jgi:SAM-dependent methyltransferase
MDVGVKQHLLKVLEPSLASLKERHLFLQHLLSQLAIPPPMTTVRVNTLKYSLQEARVRLGQILQQKYKLRACAAPPAVPHPTLNDVLVIPNQFSGGVVSPAHKEVIVGIQCAEAVLRGADVFAPGVMATPKDIKVGDSVAVFGDVEGKCCKGRCERFDGEKIFVGNGQFVMERLDVFKRDPSTIRGVAVEMTHPLVDCPSLGSDDLQDLGLLQNLPSIVTAHVLDPQPGEVVLDMCAAPGGKTSHIASLMRNQGCVVALDKSPPKVSKLTENIKRFALSNVHCYLFNSTKCLDTELSNDQPFPHAPPFPPATFDRVLLDGPCSALGQRPQMKCSLSLEELKSFQSFQRKFISQAVQLLKPGGVLVFSTCTFTPEENESQVEWLLSNYPYMKLVEQVCVCVHMIDGLSYDFPVGVCVCVSVQDVSFIGVFVFVVCMNVFCVKHV